MILLGLLCLLLVIGFSLRYAWWRRTVSHRHPRILMYHMVSEHRPGARFNKLRVPPALFERQVRWLSRQGWYFASMAELVSNTPLPEKSVVITFDDGYRDNFLNAHPVLQRYNARATLYLVVDRFDRDWSTAKKAHHDSGELMHEAKLSDDEVRQMLASEHWELGGHTLTHANLPTLGQADKIEEITRGRRELQTRFSVTVDSFAYPFGIYTPDEIPLVTDAGFTSAVTTVEGIDTDPRKRAMQLKRIKVSGKEGMLPFRLRLRTGRRGAFS